MQKYADIDNDSGIHSFQLDSTSITVWFNGGGKPYTYSYESAGCGNVEEMKRLAQRGNGLNSYINRKVKNNFVR